MLSVSEHANQYAVVFDAAKTVAARYGIVPWYGASDQDLVSAAASRGCPASELKEWADARNPPNKPLKPKRKRKQRKKA